MLSLLSHSHGNTDQQISSSQSTFMFANANFNMNACTFVSAAAIFYVFFSCKILKTNMMIMKLSFDGTNSFRNGTMLH